MGGKGSDSNLQQTAGTNAYNAARQGQTLAQINANQPEYGAANAAGFNRYAQEVQQASMFEQMLAGFGGGNEQGGPSYEQQRQDQLADREKRAEEARIAEGTRKRDDYIKRYFDAANEATQAITEKIAAEKANAATLGVNYTMTDELKSERIADYFSNLWSEGDQSSLEKLTGEFGGSNFEQVVFRGKGKEAKADTGTEGAKNAVSGKTGGGGKSTTEEDDLLGASGLLSGVK